MSARGTVEIVLDKPRNLRYDFNALSEIEDKLGVPLTEIGTKATSAKAIRSILWIGLKHEDKALTEEQVGAMVDIGNLDEVQKKLGEALSGGKKVLGV